MRLFFRQLARSHREEHPELTAEMAFSKVYADPANRELVAAERAENRPGLMVEVEKDGDRSVIGLVLGILPTLGGK